MKILIQKFKNRLVLIEIYKSKAFKKAMHFQSTKNFYLSFGSIKDDSKEYEEYLHLMDKYIDLLELKEDKFIIENSQELYDTYIHPIGEYFTIRDNFSHQSYIIFFFLGITLGLILTSIFRNYWWVLKGTVLVCTLRKFYIMRKANRNKVYGFQF